MAAVAGSTSQVAKPNAKEWDLYGRWLREVVKAPVRVIEREERDKKKVRVQSIVVAMGLNRRVRASLL
jgi:hypothetical protein